MVRCLFFFAVFFSVSGFDIFLSRKGLYPGGTLSTISFIAALFSFKSLDRSNWFWERRQYRYFAFCLLFLGFVMWALFSIFWTPDKVSGVVAAVRYLMYFLSAVIIVSFFVDDEYKDIAKISVVAAILVVSLSIWMDLLYPRTFFGDSLRPAGIGMNPNASAQTLSMLLIMAFLIINISRLFYVLIFVAIVSVLLTLSRSGILLVLFTCISGLLLHRKVSITSLVVAFVFSLVLVLFIYPVVISSSSLGDNTTLSNRIDYLVSGGGMVDLDDPRVVVAERYFSIWLEKPFLGYGVASTDDQDAFFGKATHNLYLKVLVENGLIGFLIALVFFTASAILSARKSGGLMVLFWVPIGIWGLFSNSIFDNRLFYIVFVSLIFFPLFSHDGGLRSGCSKKSVGKSCH